MSVEQAGSDLAYVRRAVDRRAPSMRDGAPIVWLWALYVAVGYPLLDFFPRVGGVFLGVGAVACGVASWVLGTWLARRQGEKDGARAKAEMLHWSAAFVGLLAVLALALTGQLAGPICGQIILLALAMVYMTAGAHYDRWFYGLGLLLLCGAVLIGLLPRYGWTTLGALLSAGLVLPTLLPRRPGLREATAS